MQRFMRIAAFPVLLCVLALNLFGFRMLPQANGAAALVKTAPGHILVTSAGMTLYIFAKDTKGMSMCSGKCAAAWPPLLVPTGSKVPAAMAGVMGKFGEISRGAGSNQLTFDGAPLYTFSADKKAGQMLGQGLAGIWWVVVVPGM